MSLKVISNPPLDRAKLVSRLRQLERLHEGLEQTEATPYSRNIAAGRSDALRNVADWIEDGEFDQ